MAARGTQSFIHILRACWSRPSLLGMELLWRWGFGLPMLALLWYTGSRIYAATAGGLAAAGMFDFSLQDPMAGAVIVANVFAVLRGPLLRAAFWIVPLVIVAWPVASGLGRTAVLRLYDRSMPGRPGAVIALQMLRLLALTATFVGWFWSIRWAAAKSFAGGEPNLILYCALVICFSLAIFSLWALLSWVFSIAPLLALVEHRSVGSSLARSLRLGPLAGKLVEINLVMGIIKLSLIVLAMVFSATPLAFVAQPGSTFLILWWGFVTVVYLAASNFFQVARLVAFVEFWRNEHGAERENGQLAAIH